MCVFPGLINLLSELHLYFLNDKLLHKFSFHLSADFFLHKIESYVYNHRILDAHHKMAISIIKRLVTQHFEDLLHHFQHNKPGEYCDLLKKTIFKDMIESDVEKKTLPEQHDVINVEASITTKTIQTSTTEEKDAPTVSKPQDDDFHCTMNHEQMVRLATFVNNIHLNYGEVTAEDLENFFHCKEGFHIQPKNNTTAVFLLETLKNNAFIKINWKHTAGVHELFLSSKGNKYLTPHDLAEALYNSNKKKRTPDPVYIEIMDFVKDLKKKAS